jgi:hypothetical protein
MLALVAVKIMVALVWCGVVVVAFVVWRPVWQPFLALLILYVPFLGWWFSQRPSNDRVWAPNTSVLAQVAVDGNAITIENVRDTEYRSARDYSPQYNTRTVHLSRLCGMDVLFFYWGSPWMSHPILVFDFAEDGRICISIEVRYRVAQKYNLLRSLYRQQELIYVVAEERDVVLKRTKFEDGSDGYLYRLQLDVDQVRNVFLDYVDVINRLHAKPRWYHGLAANCTTSFYRMPHAKARCDWRILVNGRLDQSLYALGRLDQSRPFEVLKRESRINEIANRAPRDGFGDYIRRELEELRND